MSQFKFQVAIFNSAARGAAAVSRLRTIARHHVRNPRSVFQRTQLGRHRHGVFVGEAIRRHWRTRHRAIRPNAGLQEFHQLLRREWPGMPAIGGAISAQGMGWTGVEPIGAPCSSLLMTNCPLSSRGVWQSLHRLVRFDKVRYRATWPAPRRWPEWRGEDRGEREIAHEAPIGRRNWLMKRHETVPLRLVQSGKLDACKIARRNTSRPRRPASSVVELTIATRNPPGGIA